MRPVSALCSPFKMCHIGNILTVSANQEAFLKSFSKVVSCNYRHFVGVSCKSFMALTGMVSDTAVKWFAIFSGTKKVLGFDLLVSWGRSV